MKKIAFLFVLFPLLFSCERNEWNDTVIINESDFDVRFSFYHTAEFVVLAGEKQTFPTEAFQNIEFYSTREWACENYPDHCCVVEKRIYFSFLATNDGFTGWFRPLPHWYVEVLNLTGETVTLSAGCWMPNMELAEDGTDMDRIFTDQPNFIATRESGFPAEVLYNMVDETFMVTIQ